MTGYKAFNNDLACRNFQYEVEKTYTLENDRAIKICENGFHFCKGLKKCFRYYDFGSRICEVEALGDLDSEDNEKYCTNKIKIIRELSFKEICEILGFSEKLGKLLIDSFNVSKGYRRFRCVLLGGSWAYGLSAGPFCWIVGYDSSTLYRYIGARLNNDRIELFEWGHIDEPFGYITEKGINIVKNCNLKSLTKEEIIDYCNYLREKLFENNN